MRPAPRASCKTNASTSLLSVECAKDCDYFVRFWCYYSPPLIILDIGACKSVKLAKRARYRYAADALLFRIVRVRYV